MYEYFFDLREKPFKLVPNPDYLYFSPSHARALSHLRYASAHGDGFVLITGEVGTGKTTLCRCYLAGLTDEFESAYIFNTKIDTVQLLFAVCHEFGVTVSRDAGYQSLLNAFNQFLIRQHQLDRKVVLLIDEAQNLTPENLEMVRLLSNLETTRQKLLHIVLVGQPELAEKLESYELRQLSQRISLRCRLELLTREQTQAFIKHRVMVAAKGPSDLFSAGACQIIHRYSQGIPRRINIAADRALLKAFELKQSKVPSATAAKAVHELNTDSSIPKQKAYIKIVSYAAIGVVLCTAFFLLAMNNLSVGSAIRAWYSDSEQNDLNVNQEIQQTPISDSPLYKIQAPITAPDAQPQLIDTPEVVGTAAPAAMAKPEGQLGPKASISLSETVAAANPHPVHETSQHRGASQDGGLSFAAQIALLNPQSSRMDALASLLALWQQPSPNPGQLPESMTDEQFFHIAALQYGLRLLTVENDWPLVKRLNLPVIVAMAPEPDDEPIFVTLASWQNDEMRFVFDGNQRVKVDPGRVQFLYVGPVYIFWYHTLGTDELISQRNQGGEVLRLKKLLRKTGYTHLSLNSVFDPPTYHAIVDFQMSHGLEPDGLVGPMTKIMLMAVSDATVIPHLDPKK